RGDRRPGARARRRTGRRGHLSGQAGVRAELAQLREAALGEVAQCRSEAELEAVRVKYLGRKGALTPVIRGLKDASPEERPALGALLNETKHAVEERLDEAAGRLGRERLLRSLARTGST